VPVVRRSWPWLGAGLLLYGVSAATGPMWGDCSKLTLYALRSYVPSANPGDHAGWTVVAWVWLRLLFWLDPVRSLHLLSAVAGGVAVALVHRLVWEITGEERRAGGAAAVALVAHPLWWGSAVAESYALALALALASCLLSQRDSRAAAFGAGLAAGLGAAAHVFSLVVSLPWLVRWRRCRWFVLGGAVLGLAPVWLGVFDTPADPLTGFRAGGPESWGWHLAAFVHPAALARGLGLLAGLAALALGPFGVWALVHPATRRRGRLPGPPLGALALALYALVLCTYAPYRVPLMAVFLVTGLLLLRPPSLTPLGQLLHVATQAVLLATLAWGLSAVGLGDLGVRQLPERHNAWHFLWPVKRGETGPERYAHSLLAAAPPGAVVLSDFNLGAVLCLVQQSEGLREDVEVVPTAVDDALVRSDPAAALDRRIAAIEATERAVVLADDWSPYYRLGELEQRFGWVARQLGPGWLVTRR